MPYSTFVTTNHQDYASWTVEGYRRTHPNVRYWDGAIADPKRPYVMVVHVTTVKRLGGPYDWEVELPRGTAGLDRTSTVKCGEIYTLWKDQLKELVAMVSHTVMRRVDQALALALGLHE